jgi:hypothetical protein
MKEVTNREIRDIAENIVEKTNESTNNYDAIDDVSSILANIFNKMEIAVEKIKENPSCKCDSCKCKK